MNQFNWVISVLVPIAIGRVVVLLGLIFEYGWFNFRRKKELTVEMLSFTDVLGMIFP